MGRALLDVADTIRGHPEVAAFLEHAGDDGFLDELTRVPGGPEAREAIRAFLETYGMRCVGEIDITRPRWSEHPIALVPLILGNVRNFEPGAARRQFEEGLHEDPSWSPAFVAVSGIVTEVGGLMTHGAVIAREYGVPAVVGVAQATRLIRDGQGIRVHGNKGYVELLPSAEDAGD